MLTKRFLVLACSFKYGGRCVAGRELTPGADTPGPWLRPVSDRPGGELLDADIRLPRGRPVRVLDVAEAPLLGHAADPVQPENWLLAPGRAWKVTDARDGVPSLPWLEEHPADLWCEPGEKSDRASRGWLEQHPPKQSLYLIRPRQFRVRVGAEGVTGKEKRRAVFTYQGEKYELSITDPLVWEKYHARVPPPVRPPVEFPLPCGDDLLVCVSLSREFHGLHYKIVATVFEEAVMSQPAEPPTLYTVGHSNHELPVLLGLLHKHGITAVADVRSSPHSRFNPQYNRESLQRALEAAGVRYVFLGVELGARRGEPECYDADGRARYERIAAAPLFCKGLQRLRQGMEKYRVALLCAEKDPLYCHRTILVGRELHRDGVRLLHIKEGGELESQEQAEERLLEELGMEGQDLFSTRDQIVADAYARQGERIAYVERPDEAGKEAVP